MNQLNQYDNLLWLNTPPSTSPQPALNDLWLSMNFTVDPLLFTPPSLPLPVLESSKSEESSKSGKVDKTRRERNTEASARFRARRKEREMSRVGEVGMYWIFIMVCRGTRETDCRIGGGEFKVEDSDWMVERVDAN
jgi:hypothetical protein